jgi:hypothetical protein
MTKESFVGVQFRLKSSFLEWFGGRDFLEMGHHFHVNLLNASKN